MVVGTLLLHLKLEGCRSLKDKRQVLSMIERIRLKFHVAIAEVADNDLWGNASIGVACVSTNAAHAESVLDAVLNAFDERPDLEVEGVEREVLRLG